MSRSCGRTVWSEELLARFRAEGQPYKLELAEGLDGQAISLYRNDDFEDLCRGPHLQTHQAHQGVQAALDGGCLLAGRLLAPDADAHLRHGVLPPGRSRRLPRSGRGGSPPRPSPPGARARPVPLRPALAGVAAVAPARHGDLERARGPAPRRERPAGLRRGEDAAPLRRRALEDVGPLGEVPRRHVPRAGGERVPDVRPEADELPGPHAALRRPAPQLSRAAAALRRVLDAAQERADGGAARPPAGAARDPGRRPHLLLARPDRGRDLRVPRLRRPALRHLRSRTAARALAPARQQAGLRRGLGRRRSGARVRAQAPRHRLRHEPRRGCVLRAQDRPAHDRRDRPLVADGHGPARLPDARSGSASRTSAPTTPITCPS